MRSQLQKHSVALSQGNNERRITRSSQIQKALLLNYMTRAEFKLQTFLVEKKEKRRCCLVWRIVYILRASS